MAGWRTVVLRDFDRLSLKNDRLTVEGEKPASFAISQLREVMVDTVQGSITLPLLDALSDAGINVIFCDRKHYPGCFLNGINRNFNAAGCLTDQTLWTAERKDDVWMYVVKNKIRMQCKHLEMLGLYDDGLLHSYCENVLPGDPSNREGQAARVYFNCLFGSDFTRDEENPINSALNYGYAILLSMAARIITSHGYNTALGFHHCSRTNALNLACDLMEPFRPIADRVVVENGAQDLTPEYKKELVGLMQAECRYGRKKAGMDTVMEMYFLDTVKALENHASKPKEVSFA